MVYYKKIFLEKKMHKTIFRPREYFGFDQTLRASDMQNIINNIDCPCRPEYTNAPGTTNLADAFRYASDNLFQLNRGDRPFANDVIIVITDGEDNVNRNRLLAEVRS